MRIIIIIILSTIGLGLLLNLTIDDPKFASPYEEINYARKVDNYSHAEKIYLEELSKNKLDIDLNYGYVCNHFDIAKETTDFNDSTTLRNDSIIFGYYAQQASSGDSVERDLGYYFSGLCALCLKNNQYACEQFLQVKNQKLKYLNNSLGNIYKYSAPEKAVSYYWKEINLKGNIPGAVNNLGELLIKNKDLKQFDQLLNDKACNKYIQVHKLREYYYLKHEPVGYLSILWMQFLRSIDRYGFTGALFIALIWLFYLRFIDVFEREKWYHISILFVFSAAFTYTTFILYDIVNVSLGFDLNGNWLNDLLYCILGIGLIEETIKLIPFVVFLIFTRNVVNEPIDYIIYACVAAIGFSFCENIMYFQNDSYHIMHGRALASVVGHMCDSSIVAYGFIVSKYKSNLPLVLSVTLGLILGSLVHGFYDFWLLNEAVKEYGILSILVLVISVIIWNMLKNNALNNSPFNDKAKKLEVALISKYLIIALSLVFLFEYVVISVNYGPTTGNTQLFKSVLSGTFLMVFLTGRLAHFEIKSGRWNQPNSMEKQQ